MSERIPYQRAKIWYLQSAFEYNRIKFQHGYIHDWDKNESEWGGASTYFEGGYDSPLKMLMFKVVTIICLAGRYPKAHQYLLNEIHALLALHKLDNLLKPLGKKEKIEFLQDLNLVLHNSELLTGENHD